VSPKCQEAVLDELFEGCIVREQAHAEATGRASIAAGTDPSEPKSRVRFHRFR
jgi:hypothetical protein